jgi:hypothetical protein
MVNLVAFKLTIQNGGHGTINPSGVQSVNNGVPFAIAAAPATDYRFVNWTVVSGSGVSIGDELASSTTVTLTNGDAAVQANFEYMGIRVTSPNGGELFIPDRLCTLTWWASSYTGNVKIELLKDGVFNLEISPSTLNDGSFDWTVPSAQTPGSDYRIKITTLSPSPIWWDESDANFIIEKITVTSPNGGEFFGRQRAYSITRDSSGAGYVKIEILKGGSLDSTISTSTLNSGSYPWAVPPAQTLGSDYAIRITHLANAAVYDQSNGNFSIEQITETLSNTPAGISDDNSIDITVGGTHIAAYKYKRDAGSWSAERNVTAHIVETGLAVGGHTLYVMGKDDEGAWPPEANAVTFSWQIDISLPTETISNARNNGVISSGFIIGTASDDLQVSLVEVSLDGGSFQAATGTTAWRFQLPTGSSTWKDNSQHTVAVRATDVFGHSSETDITVRKGANKDVNGDGYTDAIVGAKEYNSQPGRAYVFHSSGPSGISITAAVSASSILTGEASSGFGRSVALGDVNGDG